MKVAPDAGRVPPTLKPSLLSRKSARLGHQDSRGLRQTKRQHWVSVYIKIVRNLKMRLMELA